MSRPGVSIILDTASPLLARVRTAATAQGLALVGGRAVAGLMRDNFRRLEAERHRPNGSHFYGRAARAVQVQRDPRGASVSVAQRGIAQRRFGGTIKPKAGRKFLAYPAADAPRVAHEKGPRAFGDLDLTRAINPAHGGMQWALVRRVSQAISYTRRKQRDGSIKTRVRPGALRGGEVIFWLARKVTQRADPSVLPVATVMIDRGRAAIRTELIRRFGGAR